MFAAVAGLAASSTAAAMAAAATVDLVDLNEARIVGFDGMVAHPDSVEASELIALAVSVAYASEGVVVCVSGLSDPPPVIDELPPSHPWAPGAPCLDEVRVIVPGSSWYDAAAANGFTGEDFDMLEEIENAREAAREAEREVEEARGDG